jgi:hypothetical protein
MALSFGGVLTPVYRWAFIAGGASMAAVIGFCMSAFWLAVALPIFYALRRSLGGIPGAVAGRRGVETAAYAVAQFLVLIVANLFNAAIVTPIFVSLRQEGRGDLSFLLGFAVFLVFATIAFVLFLLIRRMFVRTPK